MSRGFPRTAMSWRAKDHQPRTDMHNAKCSKCGDMTRVPFDPKTSNQVVMCRNCRNIYMP